MNLKKEPITGNTILQVSASYVSTTRPMIVCPHKLNSGTSFVQSSKVNGIDIF
jgi:hypothetical protein